MIPRMGRELGSFQHGIVRRITGRQPKIREEGGQEYPLLAAAMDEAGFEEIGDYVSNRQNTVAQYIATWSILDLCEKMVQRPGGWVAWRWWEQEGIDLAGARVRGCGRWRQPTGKKRGEDKRRSSWRRRSGN